MEFKHFTELALRTESKVSEASLNAESLINILELHVLTGTLLDYTKKGIFYNNYSKYDDNYIELLHQINDKFSKLCSFDTERTVNNSYNFRIVHGLLGAITESSELAEILIKYLSSGSLDKVNAGEEFADCDWYKAILFDELGLSETTTRQNVIDKLRIRYPDKFETRNALNRDLDSERAELEKN